VKTAWLASRVISPWISKPITAQQLLGKRFLESHEVSKFKTKEEWEEHKKQITKMAKWHSSVLRDLKAGRKKAVTVVEVKTLQEDKKKG